MFNDEGNQPELTLEEFEVLPDDFEEEEVELEETEEETVEEEEVESTEEVEEVEQEESEEETEDTTEVALEDLEVKFLHDSKKLKDIPKEELQTYIQKGMNHDRVQEKLSVANETISDFNEIATMFDMDVNSVIETLKDQYFNRIAETEGRNVDDVKKVYNADRKNKEAKMYERFVSKFPDVKTDSLPQEVLNAVKGGEDLVSAYQKHTSDNELQTKSTELDQLKSEIEGLKKQLNVTNQNKKTKKKAVVKGVKDSGTDAKQDDFLQGLLG